MNGKRHDQFLNKLLPFFFSICCIGADRTVEQFNESDDRQGDFRFARYLGHGHEHMARILPLALGLDENKRE